MSRYIWSIALLCVGLTIEACTHDLVFYLPLTELLLTLINMHIFAISLLILVATGLTSSQDPKVRKGALPLPHPSGRRLTSRRSSNYNRIFRTQLGILKPRTMAPRLIHRTLFVLALVAMSFSKTPSCARR